jgi:hypothetical protein
VDKPHPDTYGKNNIHTTDDKQHAIGNEQRRRHTMSKKSKSSRKNHRRNRNRRRMREAMGKGDNVLHISSVDIFRCTKPYYTVASRCGFHGDTSYNRTAQAARNRRLIREEGY